MSQLSFASLTPKKKTKLRAEQFLSEMEVVVPWRKITKLIKPHYYSNKVGRPAYDLLLMVKIYCLQQWYNLADLSTEEAIYDRRSFQKFLKIDLMNDLIPDETTILNFRHLLEEQNLPKKIFALLSGYLQEKGLLLKEGSIVDATIVNGPKSTKNNTHKRDPEMSSTKKGGQWFFGLKSHIGVDAKSGLVHSFDMTTAKVSDRAQFSDMLHGEEQAVFGDKGYVNKRDKHYARDAGIYWGVLDRAGPGKQLSPKQNKRNKKNSKVRAKVEHPFRIVKHLWGHCKTRYRGLEKNRHQFYMLFGLSNIYMSKSRILQSV